MIRSELVQSLADANPGLSLRDIEVIVNAVFEKIASTGRNPRTGASVVVSAKRVPYFKAGKEMRDRLNA